MRMILSAVVFLRTYAILRLQLVSTTDAFSLNRPTLISFPARDGAVSPTSIPKPHDTLLAGALTTVAVRNGLSSAKKLASGAPDGDGTMPSASSTNTKKGRQQRKSNVLSNVYGLAGILSALSWIATAFVALSFHPDPKFADCTLRHNLLTMSQAFAFPLPVAWAAFEALRGMSAENNRTPMDSKIGRRLNLGVAAASFWLAASSAFPPLFAFGYDLYSSKHKLAASAIHGATGAFALAIASRSSSLGDVIRELLDSLWNLGPPISDRGNASCYATGAVGLLYFSIQPVVSAYPLATIPTILGKRLSRPASAFTLLGSVIAYCLKESDADDEGGNIRSTLRTGLAWGTAAHLCLIFMKIIGVDGGGLIFSGRGLWEVYPAMISVPFAAGVSFAVHAILCFGAWTEVADNGDAAPLDS